MANKGGVRAAYATGGSGLSPWQKRVLLGIAALLMAAVIVAVTYGSATQESASDVAQVSDAITVGRPLPDFEGNPGDAAVGMLAPEVRASTFGNELVTVLPGDGRSKVIGFFAHWCPHCQRELPRLAQWLSENSVPSGVEVIAVSTSVQQGRPNYPPSAWFDEVGWPVTVLRDSEQSSIAGGYGLTGFPYTVVIDGGGRVITRVTGELTTTDWEALLATAAASAAASAAAT